MKPFLPLLTALTLAGSLFAQESPKREVLPSTINTGGMELRPLISGDGQTLFFSRRQHPDNIGRSRDLQDIYISQRRGLNEWSEAENIGKPINNKDANSIAATNSAGTEALLISEYKRIKEPLALSRKVGSNWSDPEPVAIEGYYNLSDYLDFHWSTAADVLLMAVQREDSRGDQDIYVSQRKADGSWGTPLSLGPKVNSASADFAPFLAADGRTLFFASYGHRGSGGSDLYYSVRLDDSWTNWSEPKNLGKTINTTGEETYVSVTDNLNEIYFASYRQGSEKRDIYRSILPAGFIESPSFQPGQIIVQQNPEEVIEESVTMAAAQDLQQENGPAVADTPQVASNAETTLAMAEEPAEMVAAEQEEEVMVQATEPVAEEQEQAEEAVAVLTEQAEEKEAPQTGTEEAAAQAVRQPAYALNLNTSLPYEMVQQTAEGERIADILPNVYFNFNSSQLREQHHQILKQLEEIINQQPEAKVLLIGHADEVGSTAKNYAMGLQRAKSVQAYLTAQGIPAYRILISSKGETMPLASNDDDKEGRELNRRVDLQLLL